MTNGSTRPTKIAKITEFCYETAHNPSTVNWKLRCLDDEGSERRCLLRLRCVPAGLRRTSCLCRPTSGRRCSTSCRCRSSTCSCRRSAPKSLLTIAYQVGMRRASSQRRTLIIEICAVHESPIGTFETSRRTVTMSVYRGRAEFIYGLAVVLISAAGTAVGDSSPNATCSACP